MNSNSNNNICGIHKKSFELICYDCNVLMCSVCSPKHASHSFDHIDNIKANINNNEEDSKTYTDSNQLNNNNNNRIKDIQRSIQTTFDSLKIKVVEYEQLQQTEQEIESKFKELHEFLVVEEHKLKTTIVDSKQQLEQQIDKQIKIMKSLNTVNNHININKNNNNNSNDRSDIQSTAISTADTTDNYQITTIIRSISQCSDHNEFISSNNNTLFYFDYDQLDNKVNNNDDHSLLNLLLEHNKSIKINNHHDNQQPTTQQYRFIVYHELFNQIKNQIQSSFKVIPNQSHIQHKIISNQHKQSYIFSADRNIKISIINITDRINIHFEQQDIDMKMDDSFPAFNSIVKVGDFIYIFGGGYNKHNKYLKYSINTKTVVIEEMKGVDKCSYLSACYDGQDHIYIFDANGKTKTDIYRYNINNSTFERYSTIEINTDYHHLTFLFKGYIYTFTPVINKIFQFDIQNKTTVELPIEIPENVSERAVCTDGNGNIYIQSSLGLHRINIEISEIKLFDKSKINFHGNHNLIYHQSDDGQAYIYSIEGKDKNFMFSFENNKWESILPNDQYYRTYCASIFYHQDQ
ncbi:hypothetical protein PPL_07516 [Heterostelium album PN500]|uniref:B box-type domain-containing protein n=1 Tax=Heterostelium pallidum (strain ATCC 26659 / Pp 5 / PN500) TaxID=670386 RepID=D3BG65_HETP5|nr:hypothetical protein PPL_07516 [Heterostelium album PN500]EFA79657.1 hypothetical protein PPL_07516 [Heterostelium album PN500]|eukprot:XP_020431778.1 hypothetical protein PPL_07516 [Heterostelium album PN500]